MTFVTISQGKYDLCRRLEAKTVYRGDCTKARYQHESDQRRRLKADEAAKGNRN